MIKKEAFIATPFFPGITCRGMLNCQMWLLSVHPTTTMRKTADFTVVQKQIIYILHEEESKKQKVINERTGCSLSAMWKQIWRCGGKDTSRSQRTVKKSQSKNSGDISEEAGVSASRANTHRHLQEKDDSCPNIKTRIRERLLPGLRVLLSGPKSTFRIPLGDQVPGVWRKSGAAQNKSVLKSRVKFQLPVSDGLRAMSSAAVGSLCFLMPGVNADIHQDLSMHSTFPSDGKLYGVSDFIFPAGPGSCPQCQNFHHMVHWSWYYSDWMTCWATWPKLQEKQKKRCCFRMA